MRKFLTFWRYGNHSSIKKKLDATKKTINKEYRNMCMLSFPCCLTRFIKNLHVTPQDMLCKIGKNPRLVWDGSFLPFWYSQNINMMSNQEDEPEIMYGTDSLRHLTQIWNTRISFPSIEIYLFDDDVKGAFRYSKYHPDIATAFSFIIDKLLHVPMGGTSGSIVSPADVEPFAKARTHLVEFLSTRRDLLDRHKDIIKRVKYSMVPTSDIKCLQAKADKYNKGIKNPNKTSFNVFVDESLFVQVTSNIKHTMAASIDALYIVLGYPDLEKRQSPLSLDK